MAVSSPKAELGVLAPSFALPDVRTGQTISSDDLTTGPLLVMFICNHCPYVKHVRQGLAELGRDYTDAPIDIVAISSNDVASGAPGNRCAVCSAADRRNVAGSAIGWPVAASAAR